VFVEHPFLGLISQFADAACSDFATVRSNLLPSIEGRVDVRFVCLIESPPAMHGCAIYTFTFDGSQVAALKDDHQESNFDQTEIDWLPDDGPQLGITLDWRPVASFTLAEAESVHDRLWEIAQSIKLTALDANTWVDLTRRRSTLTAALSGESDQALVRFGFEDTLTPAHAHARDWARWSAEQAQLVHELAFVTPPRK
jgi:hypothetical protein